MGWVRILDKKRGEEPGDSSPRFLKRLVSIIVIHATLKKINIKGGIRFGDAGIGRMPEPIGHGQGRLGSQGKVEAGAHLGGEVEDVGQGRAVNAFGDDPRATLDKGQDRREEETTDFQQGGEPQFKAGRVGAGYAGDALDDKGGSEGTHLLTRFQEKNTPAREQTVKLNIGCLGIFPVGEA